METSAQLLANIIKTCELDADACSRASPRSHMELVERIVVGAIGNESWTVAIDAIVAP